MTTTSVTFDVAYTEQRNRGTVAIRLLMAFPHLIVNNFWSFFAGLLGFAQWFIILFTGKRNEAIWEMQNQWLAYASRVMTYLSLMHDEFPPFGTDAGSVPITYQFGYNEEANRLSNALRIFWMIPALIVSALMAIAGQILAIICWFAILFTGTMPRGMFDFLVRAHRQNIRTQAYGSLMTDVYPNANA